MRALMRVAALVALLSAAGCAAPAGCFVGLNLLPPSPVLVCGVDFGQKAEE